MNKGSLRGSAVRRSRPANSLPESRPGGIQIDRKRLRKLREKKIAQGHKPDDHEEQWPQMTM